ncbi:MinD/ParA family protein [Euhalothece natronophila Z-M001]|uniref:MinD/ParA family protein n=1 Tax=Euhalothece natronophila Z-M001 TaxID=522448 RepID=A0A5B8NK68_9CHRO|nr:MinD/ParA family protein [Euhalothece natronophila]QDZ38921.1 MinD/ParA family protein [Euhalothece natronophila Z-M001]
MSQIISIHSYRGGTGKSNVTANLAAMLTKQGNRVAVVDTDIQSPGIHVLFGFEKDDVTTSLNDYVWGKLPISQVAYDVTTTLGDGFNQGEGKLFLIPSSSNTEDIAQVLRNGYDIEYLSEGLQSLAEELTLDYLLLDTHPGLNEETLLSITISDILILILRPDRQDYQGTAVTVEVSRKLQIPKMLLLVNKAPTAFDSEQLKSKIEEIYDVEVAGVLPHSDEMMILASGGLFTVQYPDHHLTQVFNGVTQKM